MINLYLTKVVLVMPLMEINLHLTVISNTKKATIGVIKNKKKYMHIIWEQIEIEQDTRYKMSILSPTNFSRRVDGGFIKNVSSHTSLTTVQVTLLTWTVVPSKSLIF